MSIRSIFRVCLLALLAFDLIVAPSTLADSTHVPRRTASVITAPKTANAPTLDGKLDDAAWKNAQPLRNWAYRKGCQNQTEAYMTRDDKNIYLGVRCFEKNLDQLVTENKGNLMWKNDCVEIYIVPEKNEKLWTHLVATSDGKTSGAVWVLDEWNEPIQGEAIDLKCKAGKEKNAWVVEMAIPIDAFKLKLSKDKPWAWGVNRERWAGISEVSSFQGGFNKPKQYPDLIFDEWDVVFDGVGVKNRSDKPQTANVKISSGDKTVTKKINLKPGESQKLDWAAVVGIMEDNKAFAVEMLDAAGKPVAREEYILVPAPVKMVKVDPNKIPPAEFRKSVLDDPNFFPIAVWLQPGGKNVVKMYKEMGVNLFYGGAESYPNPKDDKWVESIAAEGLYVILPLKQKYIESGLYKNKAVLGWHTQDEPDLAQKSYNGGPVPPNVLMNQFIQSRSLPLQLPVFLNFGCGLGTDRFVGRAASYDMFPEYCKSADYMSFDIYPCNSLGADGPERFCTIAKGLDRLYKWTNGKKTIGFCVEANRFTKANVKDSRSPTPEEVKSQIWIAVTHRAQYLMIFCHTWHEKFRVTGIKSEMRAALKPILAEVQAMAPVLKSPFLPAEKCATVKNTLKSRVDCLTKQYDGATYLICSNMYRRPEKPVITIPGVKNAKAEVLFENRTVEIKNGKLVDDFAPYAIHRYKITPQ